MPRVAMSHERGPDRRAAAAAEGTVLSIASGVIDDLLAAFADEDRVSVGDVVDQLGAAGFPMLVLILVLPALIPIPGPYGMVFGTVVAILAIQMIIDHRQPWLPPRAHSAVCLNRSADERRQASARLADND